MANQPNDGFIPVTNDRSNWYFKKGKGNVIRGVLVGRFPRNKGKGHFYQVEVDAECPATFYDEDTQQTMEKAAPIGTLVNIDETAALAGLAQSAEEPRRWLVRIECVQKEKMSGGQSFWRIKVGRKEAPRSFGKQGDEKDSE